MANEYHPNHRDVQFIPLQIKIDVTQEHIDAGHPHSARCCPIALAGMDKGVESVGSSFLSTIYARYSLPREASAFIQAFDNGGPVEPISFLATYLHASGE